MLLTASFSHRNIFAQEVQEPAFLDRGIRSVRLELLDDELLAPDEPPHLGDAKVRRCPWQKAGLAPGRRPSVDDAGLPWGRVRCFWARRARYGVHGLRVVSSASAKTTRRHKNPVASALDHAQARSKRRWSARAERVRRAAVCKMA